MATVDPLYRSEETKTQESWGLAQNTQQLLDEVRSTPQQSGSKVCRSLTTKLEATIWLNNKQWLRSIADRSKNSKGMFYVRGYTEVDPRGPGVARG